MNSSQNKAANQRAMRRRKKGLCQQDRPIVEPHAAGIDIGAREMYVAIPPDRDAEPVRVFPTFTADLEALADWLVESGITTAAMESTGVYWIPLYQILEDHGIRCCLVSARHMKNVPGRRTDWHECQWLQYLHTTGLLRAAFRPEQQVCALRTILRHRSELVQMSSQHILHMHKALTQMNLQIQHVLSDMSGASGAAIVEAILAGERDPAVLAQLRHPGVKADEQTIRKSLTGDWRPEHLFTLRQSYLMYQTYRQLIEDCDRQITQMLQDFEPKIDESQNPLPPMLGHSQKRRRKRTGEFRFDVRSEARRLYGIDVTRLPGLNGLAIPLFSEVGRDLKTRFPTSQHFVSWLGLCPDNDKTGGAVVWRGVRKVKNRAGQMFRLAAAGLHHSDSQVADFLRRMKAKLGPAAGITAAAHKIAVLFYTLVTKQREYDPSVWAERDQQRQQKIEQRLRRQARKLGFELLPIPPGPATA